ncbi:metallophosphoesterase [Actinokineospora xionganensis]|uniref:Metallophosphoesterase n=1 Tax=Actinokineospora xionganensis TaxID=2684470 RepID=A0ABR7L228_9PSEU|nr:metallophosphoesterase [Actinokineospora xionganensis]MBC6446622.1 metallophosphoesterase [Actinokineospora xionganensis]
MVFLLLALLVVAVLHAYAWKRLVLDIARTPRFRKAGTVALAVLAVLLVAALVLPRRIGIDAARWIVWPGYLWFAVLFYLFVILMVLEIPRFVANRWPKATATDESRRLFLARGAAVVAAVAAPTTVGAGMVSALSAPEVKRFTVPIRRLDPTFAGFRIAVVSDIHLGPILGRSHAERLVRMINETQPDLVAMVGDLADGTVAELGHAAEPLRDLVSREGTYFVTGNHEYYSGHQQWITELERLGLHYLRNTRTQITRAGKTFDLAGITDLTGKAFDDGPDVVGALRGRDETKPAVLLAHQPVQVTDAARAGVDLQLSGHTHGGQLYPFHHVVGLAQPAVSGLSKVDDTWLYVTNGAGFWGPPVRVGAAPDITVLELVSAPIIR